VSNPGFRLADVEIVEKKYISATGAAGPSALDPVRSDQFG